MKQLLIILIIASVILLQVAILSVIKNIPVNELTRDPGATAEISSITGILSNLGILLWCSAASILIFSSAILLFVKQVENVGFLMYGASLTIILLTDDLFMVHEYLSDSGFWFGENKFYLVLVIVTTFYLIRFRKIILNTGYLYLFTALVFFGFALLNDVLLADYLESKIGKWMYFVEDGLKWMGISFWLFYFAHTSFVLISRNLLNPFRSPE